MIRRGQQGRRQLRRAERAAKRIGTKHGSYRPPDRADLLYQAVDDDAYRLRLQTITWRQQGRLTDPVINAQVLTAIEWETVEYIDCCHGHCHLHTRNDESPRSIAPLNCVDDVQNAYTAAVALIHDRLRIIGSRAKHPQLGPVRPWMLSELSWIGTSLAALLRTTNYPLPVMTAITW